MAPSLPVLDSRASHVFVCFAWAVLAVFSSAAPAQPLDAGAEWLENRQNVDGSFEPGGPVASNLQSDAEAELALLVLDRGGFAPGDGLLERLSAGVDDHTELLALAIRQASVQGQQAPTELIETLLERQQPDGGFADAPGHPSSVQATAFALLALQSAGHEADSAVESGVLFLREQQQHDGGWEEIESLSRVYTSALATRALSRYASAFGLGPTLTEARAYLVAERHSDGGYGTSWETAHALLAILPVTPREEAFEPPLQWLLGQQASDGDWDGDVYSTALALRALHTAQQLDGGETVLPDDPDKSTVVGRITSAANGRPVAQASVFREGDEELVANTGSDGAFELVVPANKDVTLEYAADGFSGATQTVRVSRSELVDLGEIALIPEPDTGRLLGAVTDRETGAPVAEAQARISGDSAAETGTGSHGNYAFVLPAGSYTVTITAPGYHPVSVEFQLAVAQDLKFSPGLTPVSEPPPGDEPVTVTGEVRSSGSGEPLAGALVSSGAQEVATDDTGGFRFDAIDTGEQTFTVTAAAHEGVSLTVALPPGGIAELGAIELEPVEAPDGVTLRGRVFDRASQAPIEGATINAGGSSAVSDGDGQYRIAGLDVGQTTLSVSAEGYRNRELSFTTGAHGVLERSIGLDPRDRGGLRLSSLRADADSYEAHREAELALDLENTGHETLVTRLYLAVFAADGALLSEEPVTPGLIGEHGSLPEEALEEARIRLDGGEQVTETFSWFTDARPPGDYELRVRAYEAFDGELLAERSRTVSVLPTRRVELLSVRPQPLYFPQGASDPLGFTVLLQHRSNEAFTVSGQFELADPDDEFVRREDFSFDLTPEQTDHRLDIPGSVFLAQQPGEHALSISVIEGPDPVIIHGESLFVAPGTRLEIEQHRSPGTVPPDGDHRIDIEIRLQGKEQ